MILRWYEENNARKSSFNLKKSVSSCLKEADRHRLTSIALPAISCGVFGGKPDESAQLIVEAVSEYFSGNARTFLQAVSVLEE